MTNQEKWIDFCAARDEEICIYNKPFWLDAVCDGRENWDVFLVETGGEITAALPYFTKSRLGLRYITMPKLTSHNDIWIRTTENETAGDRISRENSIYSLLVDQIEASGSSLYQQCFPPGVKNWQAFDLMGYKQETLYTFSIGCPQNMEEAERNFSKSTRQNVKKACREATVCEFDDVALFYDLNCRVFTRNQLENPISRSLIERVYTVCKANDAVKMLCAKDMDGKVCAALFMVYDSNCVHSLLCGSLPDKRCFNFLSALDYEGIRFACDTGRNYDFEGSMMEGVANYNRAFGAEMRPYYLIRKIFKNRPIISQYLRYKLYA